MVQQISVRSWVGCLHGSGSTLAITRTSNAADHLRSLYLLYCVLEQGNILRPWLVTPSNSQYLFCWTPWMRSDVSIAAKPTVVPCNSLQTPSQHVVLWSVLWRYKGVALLVWLKYYRKHRLVQIFCNLPPPPPPIPIFILLPYCSDDLLMSALLRCP